MTDEGQNWANLQDNAEVEGETTRWGDTEAATGGKKAWGDSPAAELASFPTEEFPTLEQAAKTKPSRAPQHKPYGNRGGGGGGGGGTSLHDLPRRPGGGGGGGGRDDDRGRDDRRDDRGGGRDDYNRDNRRQDYNREERPREKHPVPDEPPFTAFIGNIPFEIEAQEIAAWLDGEQQDSAGIEVVRLRKKNAYVDFETREQLVAALERDGEELKGRRLRVDVAEPPQRNRGGPGGRDRDGGGFRGGPREPEGDGKERDFSMIRNRPMPEKREAPREERRNDFQRRDRDNFGGGGGRSDGGGGRRDFGRKDRSPDSGSQKERERKVFSVAKVLKDPAEPKQNSSLFGEARPRDEAEIQKKLEAEKEKLRKEREAQKAKGDKQKDNRDWSQKKPRDNTSYKKNDKKDNRRNDKPQQQQQQQQQQKGKPSQPKGNAWTKTAEKAPAAATAEKKEQKQKKDTKQTAATDGNPFSALAKN